MLRAFLAIGDRYPAQMAILVRNMHNHELAEQVLHSLVEDVVLRPVVVALGVDESRLRTALCSVQLIGLAVARFATRPNSLIQLGVGDLVAAMAPTLQRYLDGAVRSTGGPT
jgi:pyridoxal/pyridoxine/pyridoxamine kinase